MKKIVSLILTLALLVSVFAVLPVMATKGEASLVATDISFADGVLLNFYIEADGEVTNAETVTKDGKECYKITLPVSAKEMGNDITAQLKNGSSSVGEAYTSSVKSTAAAILSSTNDKATESLVSAMLSYGAAAQKYFGYKTDALVGTPVSDTTALNAATAQSASVTDPDNVYVGASLVLEGELTLRFYFKGDVAVSKDGESLTTATKGAFTYADVTLAPDKLGEQITVSAGSATVTYSPLNYLKSKASDTALSEMAASIYAYGIAVENYIRISSCSHEGLELVAVQMPTVHNGGINEGVCENCGGTITELVGKTEADVKKYNPIDSSSDSNLRPSLSNPVNARDVLLSDGKHFYPAAENNYEGRDLYVEFSFLYNETLKNINKGYLDIFRIEEENAQSSHPSKLGNYQGHSFYFLNLRDNVSGQWCPYEGGFETGDIDNAAGGIFFGPSMPNHASTSTETEDDYLFIGDYGWHRLGIRVHQTAAINNGKVVYTVETSFYIDGELSSQYYTNLIASKYNSLLYTATISNGELVYTDIEDHRNLLYYKIRETYAKSTFYMVTADEYATAGDGFVLDVEPVDAPTREDFVADGDLTLDGTRHFKLKGEVEVADQASRNDSGKKVILISVDGLRPDAIANTEYLNLLKSMGSYTLTARTINPSKTMPAHMSMFHGVSPSTHGMSTNNVYAPSADLGLGITEVLAAQGYSMAMFFDWENMQYLPRAENSVERNYIQWYKNSGERYHERSTIEITNALLDHIATDPTDFTYLYFGMTDQMGHDHNWLSEEYYIAIEHIFSNIMRILEAVSDEYTVIITTDHGGGGNYGLNDHGSTAEVDMTTPVFIIGEGYGAGVELERDREVTILDIAPTVLYNLGVTPEEYWEGTAIEPSERERVLLVSLDGLRPDAVTATKYFDMLKAMGAYTLSAQTVNPSLTLPCHMSMLHSVTPTTHGVTTNEQIPAYAGNGITETLAAAGLTSATFYDWRELQALTKAPEGVNRSYITPDSDYKTSVPKLRNAVISHVENTPTDFTFLYFGHTDAIGEKSGFMSASYIAAVEYVFENLFAVLEALPDNYTVIITADHGGHNRTHGYTVPEDMYIPVFIIGDGFEAGADLGEGISILDIAPTVVDIIGTPAEDYWVGESLISRGEGKREALATDLFLDGSSWINYNYGTIKNKTSADDSITIEVQGSSMTGLQLKKSTISEFISLGYRYLSFTVEYGKVAGGNTPSYADVYTYKYNKDYNFHVSVPDSESPQDPGECYYASGREIIVDLWVLYQRLSTEHGLIFILSDGLYWKPTKGGTFTFSNVKLTAALD